MYQTACPQSSVLCPVVYFLTVFLRPPFHGPRSVGPNLIAKINTLLFHAPIRPPFLPENSLPGHHAALVRQTLASALAHTLVPIRPPPFVCCVSVPPSERFRALSLSFSLSPLPDLCVAAAAPLLVGTGCPPASTGLPFSHCHPLSCVCLPLPIVRHVHQVPQPPAETPVPEQHPCPSHPT